MIDNLKRKCVDFDSIYKIKKEEKQINKNKMKKNPVIFL